MLALKKSIELGNLVSGYHPELKEPYSKLQIIAAGGTPYGKVKWNPKNGRNYVEPYPWYLQWLPLVQELKKGYESALKSLNLKERVANTPETKQAVAFYKQALNLIKNSIEGLGKWAKQWANYEKYRLDVSKAQMETQLEEIKDKNMENIRQGKETVSGLEKQAFS